jgi:1-acyl-sn-glycerol-3-phosphate acyltransferase
MYERLMRWIQLPWFYWFARTTWLVIAKIVHRLRVDEARRVPREGGLVMAVNHISALDPPMMGVAVPREISFMAKKELFENRANALLMRGLHAFPVDRARNDVSAIKEAMRRLKAGRAIGIFVQGTRSAGDAAALDGAAYLAQRAGVPLQPAAIWREGWRYRVRFGEPFEVPGRDRQAIRDATATAMGRINALLPSGTNLPRGDADAAEAPVEREPERSR